MIYVLAGTRREAAAWRKQEQAGYIRYVQTSATFPGRLTSKSRIVQLPGYAKRRDTHAIRRRLKQITRLDKVPVELWTLDDDGVYFRAIAIDLETATPVEMPDGATEVRNETDEPEVVLTPEQLDQVSDQEPALEPMPSSNAPTEPGELTQPDLDALLGGHFIAPATPELDAVEAAAGEVSEAIQAVSEAIGSGNDDAPVTPEPADIPNDLEKDIEESTARFLESTPAQNVPAPNTSRPPKRVRRNKQQIAFDDARTALDADPADLGLVAKLSQARESLADRDPSDPRLTDEPSEDLDF